ncbi:Flagellin domain protein [uncultured Desulfobacterium sp.]|uniref:Flagellin domain protein n=1 Tax=uncultured Desulfobacterium sp. TaxID=201089 RepID=A0A445MZ04_9BACT|nr:Flagellin domain protein [uncultured Desulfobacterium sp.]
MALSSIQLTAGMRQNLLSLQNTASLMERTQTRLSTGLRVQSALDDPINYFAAKGHRDRAADLAYRKEEMNEGVQLLKATDAGITGLLDLIASAKSIAQSARSGEGTADIEALETQFNAIRSQIDDLADDSGYKGVNLLGGDDQTLSVFFDEDGTHSITLTGIDGSTGTDGLNITELSTDDWQTDGIADSSAIDDSIAELDAARDTLRSAAKTFSNNMSTITIRQDFTANMINTLQDGAAKLTEADLNEEGANMLMLQTRQALGTTSLSLASQAAQSVMRLF